MKLLNNKKDTSEKIIALEEVISIIEANPTGDTDLFETENAYCMYKNDAYPNMLIFHIVLYQRAHNGDSDFYGYLIIRNNNRAFSHFGTYDECEAVCNTYLSEMEEEQEQESNKLYLENLKRETEKQKVIDKEWAKKCAATRANKNKEAAMITLPTFNTSQKTGDNLIYVLTCHQTLQKYIGRTKQTAAKRFREHCALAKKGKGYLLHQAIHLYGPESFDIEVLYSNLTFDDAVETEALVIKKFQTVQFGLNMSEGGWEEINTTGEKNAFRKFSKKHKDLLEALSLNMALLWDTHKVIQDANEIRIQENKPRYNRKYLWDFPEVQKVMDQKLIKQWKMIRDDSIDEPKQISRKQNPRIIIGSKSREKFWNQELNCDDIDVSALLKNSSTLNNDQSTTEKKTYNTKEKATIPSTEIPKTRISTISSQNNILPSKSESKIKTTNTKSKQKLTNTTSQENELTPPCKESTNTNGYEKESFWNKLKRKLF